MFGKEVQFFKMHVLQDVPMPVGKQKSGAHPRQARNDERGRFYLKERWYRRAVLHDQRIRPNRSGNSHSRLLRFTLAAEMLFPNDEKVIAS
jgi:hypothetical protein